MITSGGPHPHINMANNCIYNLRELNGVKYPKGPGPVGYFLTMCSDGGDTGCNRTYGTAGRTPWSDHIP